MDDVLTKLQNLIRSNFLDPELDVQRSTTAADVPGWDSLSHVRLLLSIEGKFNIKFAPLEANRLKTVGDLANLISKKLDHIDEQ
jgi:acyl carrier protein